MSKDKSSANILFLLLRIFYILSNTVCIKCIEQRFAIEPQDQSAVVGARVTLPCRVVNKAGHLQWTKDDFGLGIYRNLSGYERYKMIGDDEEGDFSLDIREVVLDDDGMYQCQVGTGPKGEPPIRSRYAKLIVLTPPEAPDILQGSFLETIEDRDVTLDCVSVGGKPAAEITWVDSNGGVISHGVSYTIEPTADRRRFTAKSTLRFRPRRHHHNQSFICQAQNTADRAYRTAIIRIEVKYAPKVKVFIKKIGAFGRIAEGDNISIGCDADANPNDVTYRWFINNEPVSGNYTKELIIQNVSRKFNDAAVKCELQNSIGKSSESKILQVSYGPKFIEKPQSVETEIGSVTTLRCIVEGQPYPEILWLHYEMDRIIRIGKSQNLTITVNQHSAGVYWCRASVEGFEDIEAQAMIFLKGPPKITSNKTQYGVEGDSVRIECSSFSIPKPDYVMWTFGGHEINAIHNQEYAFLEESLSDGVTKSTLIIRESQSHHFGRYNCSVANVYGTDSIEIYLMADKSFPLILIISGGITASCLVAILLLLIILCHRRRRKNVCTEVIKRPDVTDIGKATCINKYTESDRNSNISDLKLELRQVEGSCDLDNTNNTSENDHHCLHTKPNYSHGVSGPMSLSHVDFMKKYQRCSTDFSDLANNLHFKVHNQSNGYVPYVDYSKDYIPPVLNCNDSLNGSMSKSIDTTSTAICGSVYSHNNSINRVMKENSCNTLNVLGASIGPDVIPMTKSGILLDGAIDVRYAATYGTPFLKSNGSIAYAGVVNTANPATTPAPPPYFALRSSTLPPVTSNSSPSSSSTSRPITSPTIAPSLSTSSGTMPQISNSNGHGSLYILPPNSKGSHNGHFTTKGNGVPANGGTHV